MDTLTITTIVGMFVIIAILLYAYVQTKREIRKECETYGEQDEIDSLSQDSPAPIELESSFD